jgi:tetratricopeptide (TPR) repeat protein
VLAAATFLGLWKRIGRLQGEDRAVAIAAFAGAAAWAAHSLVDSVNVEPMNSALMAVLLGAALGGRDPDPGPTGAARWGPAGGPIVLGGVVAVTVLAVTGWYNVWRLAPLHEGVRAATESQWTEAAAWFSEAARRDPGSTIAHQQAGLAYSILAANDSGALARALSEFEIVVRLDPDWWLNHANLGALYLAHGNAPAALQEFREAIRLGSGSALLQLNYGLAAEQAGRPDEARAAYFDALDLQPGWAGAYFWRATAFRAGVLSGWRGQAPSQPVLTLAQMQALAAVGDRADHYLPLAAESLRLGRLDEAGLLLQKASLAYFDLGPAGIEVGWLNAELAAGRGDRQAAAGLGQDAVEGYSLSSAFGPGTFAATSYAQVFFRQESMPIELAPQLAPAPVTDRWAARMVTLGDWYTALGEADAAQAVYQQVLRAVPDNAAAAERLSASPGGD